MFFVELFSGSGNSWCPKKFDLVAQLLVFCYYDGGPFFPYSLWVCHEGDWRWNILLNRFLISHRVLEVLPWLSEKFWPAESMIKQRQLKAFLLFRHVLKSCFQLHDFQGFFHGFCIELAPNP